MTNYAVIAEVIASDIVVLQSLESYMASRNVTPNTVRQDEYLRFYETCRDTFYSDIAQRTSRIVAFINSKPETDDQAKALKLALCQHMRDPIFLQILTKQMERENNPVSRGLVGSMICAAIAQYREEMERKDKLDAEAAKANKKKDEKVEPVKSNLDENVCVQMSNVAMNLLGEVYAYVDRNCVGLGVGDKIAIAAYLAMGNELTVSSLIDSDLPITADILNEPMLTHDNDRLPRVYAGILRLQKADYVKLSVNQTKFVESLTKWIYDRLNSLDMNLCLQLLVYAYGSAFPADYVKTCLIQTKDCGTQYPNLLQVTRSMKLN